MAKITKAMKEQFKRYINAYGPMSEQECLEMWDYDNNWCNSDADSQEWLSKNTSMTQKQIEDSFFKQAKPKATISKAAIKKNTERAKEVRGQRLDILEEGLKEYPFLFGEVVERTNTELKYIDAETGLGITIKIGRHKTQKVVEKTVKRKTVKNAEGHKVPAPYSDAELRALAIENVMLSNPDDFKYPAFAGSAMGFISRDLKYPWGSIKITHHKK